MMLAEIRDGIWNVLTYKYIYRPTHANLIIVQLLHRNNLPVSFAYKSVSSLRNIQ